MGIVDKAKDFVAKNPDKVSQGIDKAADAFDAKTNNKYADKVDKAQELLRDKITGSQARPAEDKQ